MVDIINLAHRPILGSLQSNRIEESRIAKIQKQEIDHGSRRFRLGEALESAEVGRIQSCRNGENPGKKRSKSCIIWRDRVSSDMRMGMGGCYLSDKEVREDTWEGVVGIQP